MTDVFKVLGQSNPAATTLTDLYTVPAATSAVVSTVTVCNQSGTARTFRISVRVGGAADTQKQYLCYDHTVAPNDTFTLTLGITLATTDKISVYASTTDLSFNAFGMERS